MIIIIIILHVVIYNLDRKIPPSAIPHHQIPEIDPALNQTRCSTTNIPTNHHSKVAHKLGITHTQCEFTPCIYSGICLYSICTRLRNVALDIRVFAANLILKHEFLLRTTHDYMPPHTHEHLSKYPLFAGTRYTHAMSPQISRRVERFLVFV